MDIHPLHNDVLSSLQLGENHLFDLINSFPYPAHIKEAKKGSYLFSNYHNLKIYGLTQIDQLIGVTIHALDVFMRPFWGKDFAHSIHALDYHAIYKNTAITDKNKIFLDKCGLVHVQRMTKIPLSNNVNCVTSVLTLCCDTTAQIDLFKLFALYRNIYNKKHQAVHYFLKFLKIDQFFYQPLTEKQLLCLLYLQRNRCHKRIASALNISIKTVETHISHIIGKLKRGNIVDILVFLHDRGQESKACIEKA